MDQSSTVLNAVEAARRIYRTTHPSAAQVGRVVEKIEAGTLPRSARGGATTTVDGVAEYLARRELARSAHGQQHRRSKEESATARASQRPAVHLYRELLKDYFLSVLLRRPTSNRAGVFRVAVAGMQALILAGAIYVLWAAAAATLYTRPIPPQEQAAVAWLKQQFEDVRVTSIDVREGAPSTVVATFSYRVNNRRIYSNLILTLRGNEVVSVDSGD